MSYMKVDELRYGEYEIKITFTIRTSWFKELELDYLATAYKDGEKVVAQYRKFMPYCFIQLIKNQIY